MVNMFALKAVFVIYGLFPLVILLFAQSRSLVLRRQVIGWLLAEAEKCYHLKVISY